MLSSLSVLAYEGLGQGVSGEVCGDMDVGVYTVGLMS